MNSVTGLAREVLGCSHTHLRLDGFLCMCVGVGVCVCVVGT